jgi:hypothetical protein
VVGRQAWGSGCTPFERGEQHWPELAAFLGEDVLRRAGRCGSGTRLSTPSSRNSFRRLVSTLDAMPRLSWNSSRRSRRTTASRRVRSVQRSPITSSTRDCPNHCPTERRGRANLAYLSQFQAPTGRSRKPLCGFAVPRVRIPPPPRCDVSGHRSHMSRDIGLSSTGPAIGRALCFGCASSCGWGR